MTQQSEDANSDLAFLRALVNEGPKAQGSAGTVFVAAGLAYGLDCLAYGAQAAFDIPLAPWVWQALIYVPVVIVLAVIGYVIWRDRKVAQHGVATRALNATYQSAGVANLIMCVVFGHAATSEKSMLIWLLYPVVMCTFQGAIWYVAYMIRKALWMALICAGWLAVALTLGLMIHQTVVYLFVLGIALIVLMGGSGLLMLRNARLQASPSLQDTSQ